QGVIRDAVVSPEDANSTRSGLPRYLAERARDAALKPRCSPLPLPPSMLGTNHTFEITFRP
ncbi:MAG: hypothetical protein M3Y41_17925, partial [Pseudomonadota bacterium]|nr:hypothetical protein [Pseudomonadota bacterium]